jgi:hypothetical protein
VDRAQQRQSAKTLTDVQAKFQPEVLSFFGIAGYDEEISDFGPTTASAIARRSRRRRASSRPKARGREDRTSARTSR